MVDLLAWSPVITAVLVALVGGWYGLAKYRTRRREPLPPTWNEMWTRQEHQDKKIAALGRMLMLAIEQWPVGSPKPHFDEVDLKLVEETIPVARFRNSRAETSTKEE